MIKLFTSIAGPDFAYAAGDQVTFDKKTEQRLVDSCQAEYVKKAKTPTKKAK